MASYQDIETRLAVVEDKIDLIMKTFTIVKRYQHPISDQMVEEKKSLLDIYHELKHAGAEVLNITEKDNGDGNRV